jgi:hypothetical protein
VSVGAAPKGASVKIAGGGSVAVGGGGWVDCDPVGTGAVPELQAEANTTRAIRIIEVNFVFIGSSHSSYDTGSRR